LFRVEVFVEAEKLFVGARGKEAYVQRKEIPRKQTDAKRPEVESSVFALGEVEEMML